MRVSLQKVKVRVNPQNVKINLLKIWVKLKIFEFLKEKAFIDLPKILNTNENFY